jgi:hypothetical protein
LLTQKKDKGDVKNRKCIKNPYFADSKMKYLLLPLYRRASFPLVGSGPATYYLTLLHQLQLLTSPPGSQTIRPAARVFKHPPVIPTSSFFLLLMVDARPVVGSRSHHLHFATFQCHLFIIDRQWYHQRWL